MLSPSELADHVRSHLESDRAAVAAHLDQLRDADVADVLNQLSLVEAGDVLALLAPARAARVVTLPNLRRRGPILAELDPALAAGILNAVPADQRTDILQALDPHDSYRMLPALAPAARAEVERLLKYPPRSAGGIMTTEFIRLAPDMTVAEALDSVRAVARERETIYACYVLEPGTDRLLGVLSLRDLILADPARRVGDAMRRNPVAAGVLDDEADVARKIGKYNLLAVPVLDDGGRVVGYVTVDDVIDVMILEQTEDVLRLGAVEPGALAEPYMATPLSVLIRKRATWLVILFLSEMLTATAMGYFEDEIAKAVVLALFVPLVISSGGNSGSQATTLIIRAMALGEVRLRDWWRVLRRELLSGLALGVILGAIGFLRIAVWSAFLPLYGPHWPLVGLTVALALVGIVTWGTLAGSMLPFLLRRLGLDPAASSAPFVATLVDVTGLIIYFSVAMLVLRGTLL